MMKTLTLLLLGTLVSVITIGHSSAGSDRETMRTHLECGWFLQLSGDSESSSSKMADTHISDGARLAADIGLSPRDLEREVEAGLDRVDENIEGDEVSRYWTKMSEICHDL